MDLDESARSYSGDGGDGGMASITIFDKLERELPILLSGQAARPLERPTNGYNKRFLYGPCALVAAVFKLQEELRGRKALLFAGDVAAAAALTKGTSSSDGELVSVVPTTDASVRKPKRVQSTSASPRFLEILSRAIQKMELPLNAP